MTHKPQNQMMLDLETFGTSGSAFVVQIGACIFNEETGLGVSAQWDLRGETVAALGGEMDFGTVIWWLAQSEEARKSIISHKDRRVSMTFALEALTQMYYDNVCQGVWSHGATFDIPILSGYYARAGLRTPWSYSRARDTRTEFAKAERYGWERPERPTAHKAMADAIAQAEDTVNALRYIDIRMNLGIRARQALLDQIDEAPPVAALVIPGIVAPETNFTPPK